LEQIEVDKASLDDQPVSPAQAAQLRAAVWLAKQGRPDFSFSVSYLQQNMVDATCSTLRLLNTTIQSKTTL
jgi:hypothetical protein